MEDVNRYKTVMSRHGKPERTRTVPVLIWGALFCLLLPWWLKVAGMLIPVVSQMVVRLYPTTVDMLLSILLSLPVIALSALLVIRGRYSHMTLHTFGVMYMSQTLEMVRLVSVMLRDGGWRSDETDVVTVSFGVYGMVLSGLLLTPRFWALLCSRSDTV